MLVLLHLYFYFYLVQVPLFEHGAGRRADLKESITIQEAISRVKTHLGLPHIRVAVAQGSELGKFTYCNAASQNSDFLPSYLLLVGRR